MTKPVHLVPLLLVGVALELTYLVYLPLTARVGVGYSVLADTWGPAASVASWLGGWSATDQRLCLLALPVVRLALYVVGAWLVRALPLHLVRKTLLGFSALFLGTLFMQPGTQSCDLYLYVLFGRMQMAGMSPYTVPMSQSQDPLLPWFPPDLTVLDIPLYGPAWMSVCHLIASVAGPSFVDQILLMRAVMAAATMALFVVFDRLLAEIAPEWRVTGLFLFAWNPLILLELGGEAHNDAVLLLLVAAAMWMAARGYAARASGLLFLACLLKFSVAPVWIGFLVLAWRQQGSVALFACLGSAAAVFALGFIPYGSDFLVTVPNTATVTARYYFNSFPIVITFLVFKAVGVHTQEQAETVGALVRHALSGGFLALLAGSLAWRLDSLTTLVRRLGTCYAVLYLVCTPYMWPHYMALPIMLATSVPRGPMLPAVIVASGTVLYIHVFPLLNASSLRETVAILSVLYGVPLASALVYAASSLRRPGRTTHE